MYQSCTSEKANDSAYYEVRRTTDTPDNTQNHTKAYRSDQDQRLCGSTSAAVKPLRQRTEGPDAYLQGHFISGTTSTPLSSPRKLAGILKSASFSRVSPVLRSIRGGASKVKDVVWDEYKKSAGNELTSGSLSWASRSYSHDQIPTYHMSLGSAFNDRPSVPQSWIAGIQECVCVRFRLVYMLS